MGGNIFNKTSNIKKEYIDNSVKKYFEECIRLFPKKKDLFNLSTIKYIGSAGKKAFSGDVDLGIDIINFKNPSDWHISEEDFNKDYIKMKKRARTATDDEIKLKALLKNIAIYINANSKLIEVEVKKVTAGNLFGMFPQYNEKNIKTDYYFQIDWMVGRLEWLRFSYYSESYEGNVKGLHRTQLLLAMFDHLGYSFGHTKGVTDKEIKEVIASTPQEAIKILEDGYNIKFKEGDINNFFKIFQIIKNLKQELKKDIFDIYLKILDRTRCDIPLKLQNYWFTRREELGLTGKFLPEDSKLIEYRRED